MPAVVVNSLSKHYGTKKAVINAVKAVSFDVAKGELFGIIGPDGAGKTSLFRMLTTLLLPDGGSATVDGSDIVKDFKAIRNKVGYMPGRFSLYQDLSVEENMRFFATIFNTSIEKNYDLVKDIYSQIEPFKTRKAGKLSGGMKQKLALSCALIHRPVVLFLDEPTTGVDAVSRKEFWEMLKRLKEQGITILVSTPYMDEANLCDRIGLMQDGRLLSIGTPKEITGSFKETILAVKAGDMYQLLKSLHDLPAIKDAYSFGEYHHAVMREGFDKSELEKYLQEKGNVAVEIKTTEPGIEDCFMQLMKN
ncbi:MAG TPA: ABC transporter ATP-binding protein [Panacibacter sp.]|nr:ABC transporter ATP-binding protein [Panacibacter sp.]HNP46692.1 ABC transporter ATP-binding protein [Panacibacter sp.]